MNDVTRLHRSGYAAHDLQMQELTAAIVRVQVLRNRKSCGSLGAASLPVQPNATAGVDPIALWKAPDDWLVYSLTLSAEAIVERLGSVSTSAPLLTADVSAGIAVLELHGKRSTEVLMRDCTLDLEGSAIPPNSCAQTLFAHASVLIHRPDIERWRLFVDRSVAHYVWDWLIDTAGHGRNASPVMSRCDTTPADVTRARSAAALLRDLHRSA